MVNEVQDMINSLAVMNIARIETHAKNVAMPVTAGIGIICETLFLFSLVEVNNGNINFLKMGNLKFPNLGGLIFLFL